MSEFHDPELRQELGRLSGPYPDQNAAFAAWQRRVGQARRRRAVLWTSGAAMSLIVATVAFAAMQAPKRQTLVPGREAAETTAAPTTTVATTLSKVQVVEPDDSSTTTSTSTLAPDTTPSTEAAVETIAPDDQAAATPAATTHKPKATPDPTTADTDNDDSDSHGVKTTFTSIGGSIVVRQYKDHLTIVDINATAGFHGDPNGHFDHIVGITFTSSSHKSEITVWLDHGELKSHVEEKLQSHEESAPGGWNPGDGYHGGD